MIIELFINKEIRKNVFKTISTFLHRLIFFYNHPSNHNVESQLVI